MKKVGVLALQGAFVEHMKSLRSLGVDAGLVRLPQDLKGLDALIMPGGETTTISRLMREYELLAPLKARALDGFPIMGTCAGMVLLANHVSDEEVESLGAMDISVRRNAFGRQVDSFEADLNMPVLGEPPFHAVFIRAPLIEEAGSGVEVLARLPDGAGVAARQGKMVALAFHPELTSDLRLHAYFVSIARGER